MMPKSQKQYKSYVLQIDFVENFFYARIEAGLIKLDPLII